MRYQFRPWQELFWSILIAGATVILLELAGLNPEAVSDWRTWGVALGVGATRAMAGAALDYLRRSLVGDVPTPEQFEITRLQKEVERLERIQPLRAMQAARAPGTIRTITTDG